MKQIKDLKQAIGKTIVGVEEVFDDSNVVVFSDNSFCICFGNKKDEYTHTQKGISQDSLAEERKTATRLFKEWDSKNNAFQKVMSEYKKIKTD